MRRWCDELTRGDHVVHVYKSDDERAKALLDLVGWMREDEKLVLLCDGPDREARDLFPLGGQVFEAAIREGRLEVLPSYQRMCPGGRFRAEALPDVILKEHGRAVDDGSGGLVLGLDCSWTADLPEGFASHVVQLSQIAMSRLPSSLTLLCQYDARRLSADQAEKVQRVHQLSLSDGRLARNFWVVGTSALGGRPRGIRAITVPGAAATGQEK